MTFHERKHRRMVARFSKLDARRAEIRKMRRLLERQEVRLTSRLVNLNTDISNNNYILHKDEYRRKWPELYVTHYIHNDMRYILVEHVRKWFQGFSNEDLHLNLQWAIQDGDIEVKIWGGKEKKEYVSFAELDKMFWFWGHSLGWEKFKLTKKTT